MAWKARDATVLVVDVGESMQETFAEASDGNKVTRAQTAVGIASKLVQHRLFFAPKHEVGLVFFGTAETSNDLQAHHAALLTAPPKQAVMLAVRVCQTQ
ncbi:hypothetical protein AK812_SmicGene13140 [Symbiodinium microadriaticum]|uniref:Ku70/Ku80 N-terminal alpha/beta domain-containing protein n=1 Tax=Symbiodinium microadriaticum TaxID=2951 RepID=A0A1Q9E8U9_SYMMI|nr:hypothetical protein AK812_SmicGene13140 [Symbiodinium microadriaticum]